MNLDEKLYPCYVCKNKLPADMFYKNKNRSTGVSSGCKKCSVIKAYEWNMQNKEKFRKANKESAIRTGSNKKWSAKNRDHLNEYMRNWNKKNKRICSPSQRYGYFSIRPVWANLFYIKEIYKLCRLRTKITGVTWNVDHIVPIKSDLVCGLHVESNLQVITESMNKQKGNRHWPDMPEAL